MSLANGTKPIHSQHLTCEEICRIIETSAKAKVSNFNLGDLRIEFGHKRDETPSTANLIVEQSFPSEAAISETAHIEKESLQLDSADAMNEKIAMALIENPLAHEAMIISEKFEDEDELEEDDGE